MRSLGIVFIAFAPIASAQPPNMQAISQALGVPCDYCHAPENALKREIAGAMIAMTRDINMRIHEATAIEATAVTCVTCHRGVAIPRPLGDILTQTMKDKGVTAAIDQYRDLRGKFYGRQAYDFGEDTLITLGRQFAQSRPSDSIALLQLNLEFYPRSASTYAEIAFAYTRKLDDASAIANLEKALEIEPNNGIIRGQLEQLKSYHRAR